VAEHENRPAPGLLPAADRIQIGPVDVSPQYSGHVSVPAALYAEKETAETRPKGYFEGVVFRRFKSIGFETDLVHQAPFNIIARQQRVLILSEAEESVEKIGRMLEEMINFSKLSNKPIIAVTKEDAELEIPTILESELRTYSSRDIKRIIRNW